MRKIQLSQQESQKKSKELKMAIEKCQVEVNAHQTSMKEIAQRI